MNGVREFLDFNDVMSKIDQTDDSHLAVAMIIYHLTQKGQVGKSSHGITPAMLERLTSQGIPDDLKSAGQQYLNVKRTEDPIRKTVEIVARYDPPEDTSNM